MNVISPNSLIQSSSATKPSSRLDFERDNIKLNNINSIAQDSTKTSQQDSIRVIRVAQEGLRVAEFGAKNRPPDSGQSSLSKKPEQQYQANQGLLEREEIGGLLGIDLFA